MINSNLGPISHRYWDTATYWPKIANFSHLLSFSALVQGDPLRIYGKALLILKLESSTQPSCDNLEYVLDDVVWMKSDCMNVDRREELVKFQHNEICVFTRESSYMYCFQCVLAIPILSVRLSVFLLHGWISQKWCKLESPNLHLSLIHIWRCRRRG